MKKQAMKLGAKVQSAVSAKTDLLVCGENTGAAKITKAKENSVRIMIEDEYVELLH